MRRIIVVLAFSFAVAHAQMPQPAQVRVASRLKQADGVLTPDIKVTRLDDGSHTLEIRLTNRAKDVVSLQSVEVEFPWTAPQGRDFLVSAGATVMGRWPMQVVDPVQDMSPACSGTYLLARGPGIYSVVAFLSWKTFWSKMTYHPGRVIVSADGEARLIRSGETVALEKLWFAENTNWSDLLYSYADAIVRDLRITLKPARNFVGWSTWDYYGRTWKPADVLGNLDAITQLVPKSTLLQIDGGWWRYRGEYRNVRENLQPDGMRTLATAIRARGLTAGIHLDGTRGEISAPVAQEHPEFFLKDERGKLLREMNGPNHNVPGNVFYDFSHPGARSFFRDALRGIRGWGFDYIKIDFLMGGLAEDVRVKAFNNDPAREFAVFDRGLTSVERLHLALAAFREGMGADAYFVGCSAPFGPTFGHVDGLRTSPDIAPNFAQYKIDCEANAGNFYLHGKVVHTDADYLVVRAQEDEDATLVKDPSKTGRDLGFNEAEMWTHYITLFGGTKLASDNLMILRDERKELVRRSAALPTCSRFIPLDYWQCARTRSDAFNVLLGEGDGALYLALFNWTDAPRTYRLSGLSAAEAGAVKKLHGAAVQSVDNAKLVVTLAGRHSAIFQLGSQARFDSVRRALVLD